MSHFFVRTICLKRVDIIIKMAALSIFDEFLSKKDLNFQSFYKDLINEMIDIEEMGENLVNSLRKSANSARFWSKKLEKFTNSKTLILTTFSAEASKHITYLEIFESLSHIIDLKYIKELYEPENQRYVGIIFEDEEKANYVAQNFHKVGDSYVIFTKWVSEAHIFKGRIHWLPNFFDLKLIEDYLNNFFYIKSIVKATKMIAKDFIVNTNVIVFEGLLKFGVTIDGLPHLKDFENNKALITLKGRPPLCLNCNSIGHTKAACKYSYCKKCKMDCLRTHSCSDFEIRESYADILKTTEDSGMRQASRDAKLSEALKGQDKCQNEEEVWINVKRGQSKSKQSVVNFNDNSLLTAASVCHKRLDLLDSSDCSVLDTVSFSSPDFVEDVSFRDDSGQLKRKWSSSEQPNNALSSSSNLRVGKKKL